MATFNTSKQKRRMDKILESEEEKLVEILSKKYELPYVNLSKTPLNGRGLSIIKESDAREATIGIFNKKSKTLDVAIFSPNDEKTKEALEVLQKKGYTINLHMASHAGIKKIWKKYKDIQTTKKVEFGVLDISSKQLEGVTEKFTSITEIKKEIEKTLKSKELSGISSIFEIVLGGAIAINVSDIHFDPQKENVRLRYRLDGMLSDVTSINHKTYRFLVSRIKLLSGLKLNINTDTQDGRFSIRIQDLDIQIRTSILPGPYAEAIVLRILNPKSIAVSLEELGIEPHLYETFKKEMSKPNGMILNTGPTGSGKTTTLYAFLRKIYNENIKIITIEDPIEYHIQGVTQTQVDPKTNYTFLSGLRAALRQDPDVIMVGEIRDSETAKIAINSSLTGHLVLSSLHTNTAAGAIPRFIDLGVNPKVLTSAISIIIAQRLARVLCKDCKKETTPNDKDLDIINKNLKSIKEKRKGEDFTFNQIKTWIPNEEGCDNCNSGYKGRIGIYEAVLMDENISKIITENPNERDIQKAAIPQGIFNMQEDGILKVLKGVTSMDELGRIIDFSEI